MSARKTGPLLRGQVSDRAAEEGDHPPAALRQQRQVAFEVADHGVDGHPRVLGGHRGRRRPQRRLVDVEGNEAAQRPPAVEGVEEEPGLLRRARAELDQRVGAGARGDLAGPVDEDAPLGAGRVVLR